MAFQVQQRTSREAEASGRRLGRLPYSHASFERVTHAVGEAYVGQHQQIERTLIEAFKVPAEAHNASVSLDRVSVPMEEPSDRPIDPDDANAPKRPIDRVFRMGYCGTVTLHDGEGEPIHTIRYGTMPDGDPDTLCMGMADDVAEMLVQRPDLKVALLCDGAKEMWNLLDAQFTTAPFDTQELRHRPHDRLLARHREAGSGREGDGRRRRGQAVGGEVEAPAAQLEQGECTSILAELTASGKEFVYVGESQPVHDAITYFTNNAGRMNYATARRQGLPIGSGSVEATCKSLFNLRMDRSGSRWKGRTGEHIVHLRALALSDRWDAAMDLAMKQPRVLVRAAA